MNRVLSSVNLPSSFIRRTELLPGGISSSARAVTPPVIGGVPLLLVKFRKSSILAEPTSIFISIKCPILVGAAPVGSGPAGVPAGISLPFASIRSRTTLPASRNFDWPSFALTPSRNVSPSVPSTRALKSVSSSIGVPYFVRLKLGTSAEPVTAMFLSVPS